MILTPRHYQTQPSEFLNGAWTKAQEKDNALNLTKLIARFNEMSMNVIQTILNEDKMKSRCKVVQKLIKIAKHLHELRNYNSMMAIYAALSHSSILRLKWTMKHLKKQTQKSLLDLEKLMDRKENYYNYRSELRSLDPTVPCIPFMGIILTDMTFIQEGNKDFAGIGEDTWTLNIQKLKMFYNTIKQIQLFQGRAYPLCADSRLAQLLTPNFNIFGEASALYLNSYSGSSNNVNGNGGTNNGNCASSNNGNKMVDSGADAAAAASPAMDTSSNKDDSPEKQAQPQSDVTFEDEILDDEDSDVYEISTALDHAKKLKTEENVEEWSPMSSTPASSMRDILESSNNSGSSNLQTMIKLQERSTHQLLDSIINGRLDNEEDENAEVDEEESPLPEHQSVPIVMRKSTSNSSLLSTPPDIPSPHHSLVSLPSFSSGSGNPLIPIPPVIQVTSTPTDEPPSSTMEVLMALPQPPSDAPKKIMRGKSVSASNIYGLLAAPHSGNNSHHNSNSNSNNSNNNNNSNSSHSSSPIMVPSNNKTHNRSYSTSAHSSGGSSGKMSPPPANSSGGSSGSFSPSHAHHGSTGGGTFSIFNKRKSVAITELQSQQQSMHHQRPPHSFTPMSDEALFKLSQKLEPKGAKLQDIN
ncbi:hypothetical protein SAMD00019534_021030 [Acytostelium subglobosum LB1]|uniref:hypothetical protein n=1 Tax=Acytostelium subglobosum LB1 TaxID=1410327 RepID=UPI000645186E|nr:hypothetical protein SAMD00019534_021030 [Acytostelium subglobosum LB1]GAM18928.1 hypothetical protein SAMD00019534_021030 [Acytostelium subglobosum LB1]|eukprot:XP_012758148.1 hypothetical protein SAMD00019534_021030 [Acytostelium subglobosum LB1]